MAARIYLTLAAAILTFTFCRCDSHDKEPVETQDRIEVVPETMRFSANGGRYFLDVKSTTVWSVSSDGDWCRPDDNKSQGDMSLRIDVDANPDFSERKVVLTFQTKENTAKVTITQNSKAEPTLDADREKIDFESQGGTTFIEITSNYQWSAQPQDDWLDCFLEYTPVSWDGTHRLRVDAASWEGEQDRESQIIITGEDLEITIPVFQTTAREELITITDPVFRKYLLENFDYSGDGNISTFEAAQVRDIDVWGLGVASLEGIEYFTSLETLSCAENKLTSLDISSNTSLTQLLCARNKIPSLDLSANVNLKEVACGNNPLTELDVSANTALIYLRAGECALTRLVFPRGLKELHCAANELSVLDLSGCENLEQLSCGVNLLTTLDIGQCPQLKYLSCTYNRLTSLDVTHNRLLTSLACGENQIDDLDVSSNTALTILNLVETPITRIDLSNAPDLKHLTVTASSLIELDITSNTQLFNMNCTECDDLEVVWVWKGFSENDHPNFRKPDGVPYRVKGS